MSTASTLPKSVQAQARHGGDSSAGAQDRAQFYQEFINKYKQLPDNFLRIPASYYASQQLQPSDAGDPLPRSIITGQGPLVDMIDISVVEAQLVKNYGLLRMDLYCKIRVGHMVCETQTCPNGAKNPKWDGVYQFSLKPGIDSFHLEIYDEKQFSLDEKIAWLHERIPQEIFAGITVERWFPLSGRSGPNKEGSVLLVISHKRMPMRASNFGRSIMPNHHHHHHHHQQPPLTVFVPAGANQGPQVIGGPGMLPMDPRTQVPTYIQAPPTPADQPAAAIRNEPVEARPASEEDINQLSEMFPSIDKAIIKAVLENNNNDKETAIGTLLTMG